MFVVFGRATVRIALLDMIRKPESRGFHDPTTAKPLNIVTGMGNNSKDGEAVIKVRATKTNQTKIMLRYRDLFLYFAVCAVLEEAAFHFEMFPFVGGWWPLFFLFARIMSLYIRAGSFATLRHFGCVGTNSGLLS